MTFDPWRWIRPAASGTSPGTSRLGLIRRLLRARQGRHLLRGLLAGAHAVGHPDALVKVAGNGEVLHLLHGCADALDALQMPGGVLRHGALPAVDLDEPRLRRQSGELPDLLAHDRRDLLVAELQHALVAGAAQETAQKRLVVRRAE